jgi:hypothetical protein
MPYGMFLMGGGTPWNGKTAKGKTAKLKQPMRSELEPKPRMDCIAA